MSPPRTIWAASGIDHPWPAGIEPHDVVDQQRAAPEQGAVVDLTIATLLHLITALWAIEPMSKNSHWEREAGGSQRRANTFADAEAGC